MVNMLIANKDIFKLKNLVNNVVSECESVKITKMTTDGEETLKALSEGNIDLAVIDIDLPTVTGIDIIKHLEKEEILQEKDDNIRELKYKNSIMIIIKDFKEAQEIIGSHVIFDYVIQNTSDSELLFKLERLVRQKDKEENRKRILKELKYIGYNVEYVGTNYLTETILQMHMSKEGSMENFQKQVYPIISKMYNKSVHNIKCNINRATECMYYECDSERLKNYFGFFDDTKPTAKTVAYTVLNKIS